MKKEQSQQVVFEHHVNDLLKPIPPKGKSIKMAMPPIPKDNHSKSPHESPSKKKPRVSSNTTQHPQHFAEALECNSMAHQSNSDMQIDPVDSHPEDNFWTDDSATMNSHEQVLNETLYSADSDDPSSDKENTREGEISGKPALYRNKWPYSNPERIEGWPCLTAVSKLLNADEGTTCDTVPQLCRRNATFIIDTSKLSTPVDISGDDNGAYDKPTTIKQRVKVQRDEIYRCKANEPCDYVLKRRYYKHKGTPTFRRIVYVLYSSDGKQHKYSMLQYYWVDGNPTDLVYTRHGN